MISRDHGIIPTEMAGVVAVGVGMLQPAFDETNGDRSFSEIELRAMLEQAISFRPDHVLGRYVIMATHKRTVGSHRRAADIQASLARGNGLWHRVKR